MYIPPLNMLERLVNIGHTTAAVAAAATATTRYAVVPPLCTGHGHSMRKSKYCLAFKGRKRRKTLFSVSSLNTLSLQVFRWRLFFYFLR